MRNLLIAAAAGLMTLSALPVAAATAPQERPYQSGPMNGPMSHGPQSGPMNHGPGNGPMNGPNNGPGRDDGPGRSNDQYGRWDNNWGARPAGPPRHWTRQSDWYRHVRACSQRYRSYNPRTDTFVVRRGQTAMCRL